MISEWELWAVAVKLVEQHGDDAHAHALGRQRELEVKGDTGGVNAWTAIAARIRALQERPRGLTH